MTSAKPYLVRAIYEWLQANNQTIYISVDTTVPYVAVPKEYIQNDKIVLDISPLAVTKLIISNEALEGKASFGTKNHELYIPIAAITAIFSHETQQGMVFPPETETGDLLPQQQPTEKSCTAPLSRGQKPHLKLVQGGLDNSEEREPA